MQQSGSGGPGNQGNMQGNMQKIGEGLGGLMGQAADNALGMFGTMMNNMGGWWAQAGNAQQQQGGGSVQASFNSDADNRYRGHFEAHTQGSAQGGTQAGGAQGGMPASGTRSYDDVRPLYHFGHMASQNPDYSGRGFHEVEPELQRHWGSEQSQRHGSWPEVRGFVEFGYSGHKSGGAASGGTSAQGGASGVSGSVNASGGAAGASGGGTSGGSSGGFHASGSIDTSRDPGNTGP